jgi:hypothetical protein
MEVLLNDDILFVAMFAFDDNDDDDDVCCFRFFELCNKK